MKRQLAKFTLTGLCTLVFMAASTSTGEAGLFPFFHHGGYSAYRPVYRASYYGPRYGYTAWRPVGYYGWYGARPAYCGSSCSPCSSCYSPCGSVCDPCSSCCSPCGIGGCSTGNCGISCASAGPSTQLKPTPDNGTPPQPRTFGDGDPSREDPNWKRTDPGKSPGDLPDNADPNLPADNGDGAAPANDDGLFGRETRKVPPSIPVPQREEKSPETKQPEDSGKSQSTDEKNDKENSSGESEKNTKLYRTLDNLDRKITWRSTPRRVRLEIHSNLGQVRIARRVVNPNQGWRPVPGTQIVRK